MITLAQSALAEGNVCCVLMSSQGWRSRAASPPPTSSAHRWTGVQGVSLCSPSQQKQPASRCRPAHTPHHPTAPWNQSPDSQPFRPPPQMWLRHPLPPPRTYLPQSCWCDSDQGIHTSVPKSLQNRAVTLHKIRDAQTGPTLIPSIPLTGAVSHLSSALISTHLVFH